jgi:hypothetical protein
VRHSSSVRPFRRRRELASALGVVALTLTAAAAAGDRLKTRSASTTVTGEAGRGSAQPRCDRGTRAISGGFETNADVNLRQIYVNASELGGRRRWTVGAHNFSPNDALLTAFAYCRDERTKARSKTFQVEGAGDVTATASCGRGKQAISGGFRDLSGADARPTIAYESRRASKRKWTVTASNTDGEPGRLQAHVYCRKGGDGLRAAERRETFPSPGPVDGDVIARCRRDERVLSGGFTSDTVPLPGKGQTVQITASRKVGKRKWRVSVAAIGTAVTVTVHAYCET